MVGCLFLTRITDTSSTSAFFAVARDIACSNIEYCSIMEHGAIVPWLRTDDDLGWSIDGCDRGNGREEEETKKNRYTGYARSCLINTPPLTQNTEIDTNARRKCAGEKAKEITITRVSRVTCVIPTRCGARNSDAMRSRDRYAIGRSIVGLNAALVYSVCQLNINRRRRTRTGPQQLRIADAIGHLTVPRRVVPRFHLVSYLLLFRSFSRAWT